MALARVIAFAATMLVLGGCSAPVKDDDFDDEKSATTASALDDGTSSTELADLGSTDPAAAASSLAASKTKGCRTRTLDATNPNVVHVALVDCTGRFGRHVVNGNLTVTFSSNADGALHAETVSSDLTIDGRPFSRQVSSDIRVTGGVRYVSRHSHETGTKPNGDSLVHTGDHVVVTDTATRCRTVNGTATSVIAGSRTVASTITNLQTCETDTGEDLCPTGTIEHVNDAKRKTVLATFDGSSTATIDISKPKGEKTKSWALDCTPR
jgi:hypothetical protein